MMKSKRAFLMIAVALIGALVVTYVHFASRIRLAHEQSFSNGYRERQFFVDSNVTVWELWRETQATNILLTVCVFRDGGVDSIMPTKLDVGSRTKAAFFVWLDRNGKFRFNKDYADLPSLLPVLRKAAQARIPHEDVLWPMSFGIEQGAPVEHFLGILRASYPLAEDGIEVMRDVDLETVPVFGI